jgi:hypothetical protein
MAEEETHANVKYERKDIRLRWVVGLFSLLGVFVICMLFAMLKFYWYEEEAEKKIKGPTEALAPALPPEPRLEQIDKLAGVEASNVDARLAAQEEMLNSYGPTGEKGFVHVPIQRAIEAVADKLPVREQPPGEAAKGRGPVAGGDSNSGRMIRGEGK